MCFALRANYSVGLYLVSNISPAWEKTSAYFARSFVIKPEKSHKFSLTSILLFYLDRSLPNRAMFISGFQVFYTHPIKTFEFMQINST